MGPKRLLQTMRNLFAFAAKMGVPGIEKAKKRRRGGPAEKAAYFRARTYRFCLDTPTPVSYNAAMGSLNGWNGE
jgi:hypothetical protein